MTGERAAVIDFRSRRVTAEGERRARRLGTKLTPFMRKARELALVRPHAAEVIEKIIDELIAEVRQDGGAA